MLPIKENLTDLEKKESVHDDFPCIGFDLPTAEEAFAHFRGKLKVVHGYGDVCNNHALHTWDDGKRLLCRCTECRGWVLVQESDYHGLDGDVYYADYFPVNSPSEAVELNEKYDGYSLEVKWQGKKIFITNGKITSKW